jgi:hypothetical protein
MNTKIEKASSKVRGGFDEIDVNKIDESQHRLLNLIGVLSPNKSA